jgi:hypothetical protein
MVVLLVKGAGSIKVVFDKNYERNMCVSSHFGQGFSLATGPALLDRAIYDEYFTTFVIS